MQLRICIILIFLVCMFDVCGQIDTTQERKIRQSLTFSVGSVIKDSVNIGTSYVFIQIDLNRKYKILRSFAIDQSLKFPNSIKQLILDSLKLINYKFTGLKKIIIPVFIINNLSVDKDIDGLVKQMSMFFSNKRVKNIFQPNGIFIFDSIILTIQPRDLE